MGPKSDRKITLPESKAKELSLNNGEEKELRCKMGEREYEALGRSGGAAAGSWGHWPWWRAGIVPGRRQLGRARVCREEQDGVSLLVRGCWGRERGQAGRKSCHGLAKIRITHRNNAN